MVSELGGCKKDPETKKIVTNVEPRRGMRIWYQLRNQRVRMVEEVACF